MSKIDPITPEFEQQANGFTSSYEKLIAAESVLGLIAPMTGLDNAPATAPAKDMLEQRYDRLHGFKRARFDAHCKDLALLAKNGVSALLQLKGQGRTNLDAATARLFAEIDGSRVKAFRQLGQ